MIIKPDAILRGAIVSTDGTKLLLCFNDYDLVVSNCPVTNVLLFEECMSRSHGDFNSEDMNKVRSYVADIRDVRLKQLENLVDTLKVPISTSLVNSDEWKYAEHVE